MVNNSDLYIVHDFLCEIGVKTTWIDSRNHTSTDNFKLCSIVGLTGHWFDRCWIVTCFRGLSFVRYGRECGKIHVLKAFGIHLLSRLPHSTLPIVIQLTKVWFLGICPEKVPTNQIEQKLEKIKENKRKKKQKQSI